MPGREPGILFAEAKAPGRGGTAGGFVSYLRVREGEGPAAGMAFRMSRSAAGMGCAPTRWHC